ncbi:MAG: four helix bundle protein [Patescibacteria group bacterium]|nr:four helix bundle protein [Patescibacteria group bacterium]
MWYNLFSFELGAMGLGLNKFMLFRFREFRIYKEALVFRKVIYGISKKFPKDETFCLTSQVRRAINSVVLNIAEGSNRNSDLDFKRFLYISLTSLEEVVACLDIALDENYLTVQEHRDLIIKAEELGKQLIAFINKLRA